MDQQELNQEIARVTGETEESIAAMGFGLLSFAPPLLVVDKRARLRDPTRQRQLRRQPYTAKTAAKTSKRRSRHPAAPSVAKYPRPPDSSWHSAIFISPPHKLVFFDQGA